MITKAELVELDEYAKAAAKRYRDASLAYAKQECPISIGDDVVVCGYTHKGKKMRVDAILPARVDFHGAWRLVGTVYKSDGSLGKQKAEFSEYNWRNL